MQLIVPYAPGGSGDLLARLLGNQLSKLWGQQVVVENKAGAGGLIGTEAAAKSAADGYTLYLATDGPLTIAATLHRHLHYDWKRDFAPISMMAVGYQILLASPKLPASNLKDFIALAKQNPGKYNFASIGVGSAPHLAAELFLDMAGLKLTHVPYPGSSQQCIAALISGDVAMFMVGISTAVPFVKAGTVRGLAVTAPKRIDSLPNVPTFAEEGMPKMDYSLWFAIEAPSGTPPAIIKKVHDDMAKVAADADVPEGASYPRLRGAIGYARATGGVPGEQLFAGKAVDRAARAPGQLSGIGLATRRAKHDMMAAEI